MTTYWLKQIEPSEKIIQDGILRLLALHPTVAWAHRFNAGAHAVEDTDAEGRKRRRFIRYAFPGCPDILGQLKDGRFLAIEVKAPRGRATEAQTRFLELVAEHNGVAMLARSAEDVSKRLQSVHGGVSEATL